VLEQEVEGRRGDVGLDRHVGRGLVGDALDDAPVDRPRREPDHLAEPLVQRPRRGLARWRRCDRDPVGAPGAATQVAALGALRARRGAPVGAQAALELAQVARRRQPPALRQGELLAVALRRLELGLRHRVGQDLDHRRRAGLDERPPVAVHDVAARRLDLDLADAVLARLDDVVVAGQHLEKPEPEEDHREQHEREAAEHGHAHRELRRDRRAAIVDRRRHQAYARLSGLRPPVVYARRRRRRGSSGR
jgi:hypothetical protein